MSTKLNRVVELFGKSTGAAQRNGWSKLIQTQHCPYLDRKCVKNRKSQPEIAIGTCTVRVGKGFDPVVICPHRFLERRQIFVDSLHLLTGHVPGNEIHVVPEVSIPGGNVDFVLASTNQGRVKDFVGIEIQTLDTTGTVWPERQRFLQSVGLKVSRSDVSSDAGFGMNWKMTAKTILVQLHHKVETFEHINRHFVLAIQDSLLKYMREEFSFEHVSEARLDDCVHFHSYSLQEVKHDWRMKLVQRLSTDADGVGKCLGLSTEARVEFSEICKALEAKISERTLFKV